MLTSGALPRLPREVTQRTQAARLTKPSGPAEGGTDGGFPIQARDCGRLACRPADALERSTELVAGRHRSAPSRSSAATDAPIGFRACPILERSGTGRVCETRAYGVTTCAAGGWYVERPVPIAPSTGWKVTDVGVTESLRIESVTEGGSPTSESARAAASETSF